MDIGRSAKAGWIAGFWDGEGSVKFSTHCHGKKHTSYYLSVGNTDPALIATCAAYLTDLGIPFSKFEQRDRRRRKPFIVFHICQADAIRRFHRLIPICAPEKKRRLEEIVEWINRPHVSVWEQRRERIETLWAEGHSINCIVHQLGLKGAFFPDLKKHLAEWGIQPPPQGRGRKHCGCLRTARMTTA
jgi:LAGLIDADG-like domain